MAKGVIEMPANDGDNPTVENPFASNNDGIMENPKILDSMVHGWCGLLMLIMHRSRLTWS